MLGRERGREGECENEMHSITRVSLVNPERGERRTSFLLRPTRLAAHTGELCRLPSDIAGRQIDLFAFSKERGYKDKEAGVLLCVHLCRLAPLSRTNADGERGGERQSALLFPSRQCLRLERRKR